VALAFKIQTDPHSGTLTYCRLYSGTLETGSYVHNINTGKRERIGRLVRLHANKREDVKKVVAGDIAAIVGLKHTRTGDTLCGDKSQAVLLESIQIPVPVISVAIEPATPADEERLTDSLKKLSLEDPSFHVSTDENSGQTLISGMGELHLEIISGRLLREFSVNARVGKPQVAYRETITGSTQVDTLFEKQSGGRGHYAHVIIDFEPGEPGEGLTFENQITGGAIPKEFIPAVEMGIRESMEFGFLGGYPVVSIKATLRDGNYHEVDSSEIAFKVASSQSFRQASTQANAVLLEPIMSLDVVVPDDYMGEVIGDISARRGRVSGVEARGSIRAIEAEVPIANMFGYSTVLRSLTQGRGTYAMEFSHYAEVPAAISDSIINRA